MRQQGAYIPIHRDIGSSPVPAATNTGSFVTTGIFYMQQVYTEFTDRSI